MNAVATGRFLRLGVALAAVAALAACIKIEDKNAPKAADAWTQHLKFDAGALSFDGDAVVIASGGRTARIAPNGDLAIDGRAVAVGGEQRKQLVEYHAAAHRLRTHAGDTGRAGVQLAKDVVTDVLADIGAGKPGVEIEKNLEQKVGGVKRAAARLCDDLVAIRAAQEGIAAAVPDFAPFATIDQADVDDCRKDTAPPADAVVAGTPASPSSAAPGAAAGAGAATTR